MTGLLIVMLFATSAAAIVLAILLLMARGDCAIEISHSDTLKARLARIRNDIGDERYWRIVESEDE